MSSRHRASRPTAGRTRQNGTTPVTERGIERTGLQRIHLVGQRRSEHHLTAGNLLGTVTVIVQHHLSPTIINDITVYGWDETVFFRNGDPFIWDPWPGTGMVNRLQRVG